MDIRLTGLDTKSGIALGRSEDETLPDFVLERREFAPLFEHLKIGDRLTVGASFDEQHCRIVSIYTVNERQVTASGNIRKI